MDTLNPGVLPLDPSPPRVHRRRLTIPPSPLLPVDPMPPPVESVAPRPAPPADPQTGPERSPMPTEPETPQPGQPEPKPRHGALLMVGMATLGVALAGELTSAPAWLLGPLALGTGLALGAWQRRPQACAVPEREPAVHPDETLPKAQPLPDLDTLTDELRTPASAVEAIATLMLDGPMDPTQRRLATLLRTSAQTLMNRLDERLGAQNDRAPIDPAAVPTRRREPGQARVLLADDNAINRELTGHLLQRLGETADMACDGLEALARLAEQDYDVVLMDVRMPRLDGLTATGRIRRTIPPDRQPWVIALTAQNLPGDRQRCLAAGCDDYLAKPLHVDQLAAALTRARQARQEVGMDSLDPQALGLLRTVLPPSALFELLGTYLASSDKLVAELQAALVRGDTTAMARLAHTLKSSSGQFGALRLSKACADLEAAAKSTSDATSLTRLVTTIVERHAEARLMVEAERRATSTTSVEAGR